MNSKQGLRSTRATAILISFPILATLLSLICIPIYADSFMSSTSIREQQTRIRSDIIAKAQVWVQAQVPYNERGRFQGYREDCSGFVSMAWGLPSPGLTTYTLPSVSQQINKDDLQPGDIVLNENGGGNSNFAHVVIFDRWVDSSHTHYNAYEENPYWGGAHYTVNIPYPFWLGYDTSEYVPMRLKTLTTPPTATATLTPAHPPVPTQTPTLTVPTQLQGTLVQAPSTFQVALQITQAHGDGSFDGKWYATINGSEEDVIVNGVIVSFDQSNQFSQISQEKVQQLQQQVGSNGTLLWFTSTSYDVGQDIWLGCEYYGVLQANGSVQGVWYPPGSDTEGGTFQLA